MAASAEYPTIQVDWTLACDFHGLVDEDDIDGDDGMDEPEYAHGTAVRPDTCEVLTHIEGDDPTWLKLGEVPVYLVKANEECSAKGRAIFDRLYSKFGVPKDLLDELPSQGETWRCETTSYKSPSKNGNDGEAREQAKPNGLKTASAPVRPVDAPGTLVLKVMSLVRGANLPSTIPRQRDSSQSYGLEACLLTGSSTSADEDANSAIKLSWKIKWTTKFHWSSKQRNLPILHITVVEKSSAGSSSDIADRLRASVQLAPLVIHPGQVLDSWFPCYLIDRQDSKQNNLGVSRDPLSIRVVAQYVPDAVPVRKKVRTPISKSKTISTPGLKSTKPNQIAVPWGAGSKKSGIRAKGRTSELVLQKDPGLSGTLATASGFDSQQLSLISELRHLLKHAKLHLKIIGCRKMSPRDSEADEKQFDIRVSLGGSLTSASSPIKKGTTGPVDINSIWNKEFLMSVYENETGPGLNVSAPGNSPVVLLDFMDKHNVEMGNVNIPLLPFILGQGHVSDCWYPIYSCLSGSYSCTSVEKLGEVRLLMMVHSLNKIKPRIMSEDNIPNGVPSKSRACRSNNDSDTMLISAGAPVVTEHTLIVTVKKAMGVVLDKASRERVIAPKVTVTLCLSNGMRTSASTTPLEYLAPASDASNAERPSVSTIQDLDSHVNNHGILDAAWREDLFIDIPTNNMPESEISPSLGGLSGAVLRFDLADANAMPPYARSTNAGRNEAMIFATGSQDISDVLAQSLSKPAGPSKEIWITLNGGGQILCSMKRGPLPPPSPKLRNASPRAIARGNENVAASDLGGVLHLHVSDLKGVHPEISSAFVRARTVNHGNAGDLALRTQRGVNGIHMAESGNGNLVYGLTSYVNSVSTAVAVRNAAGIMVWDEHVSLKLPNFVDGDNLPSDSEDEKRDTKLEKWLNNTLIVISIYATVTGSSVYTLVGEVYSPVTECLGNHSRQNYAASAISKGTRFLPKSTLGLQVSLSKINNSAASDLRLDSSDASPQESPTDDGDSKTTMSQLTAVADLKKTFYCLDRDRSGTVSANELVEFLMENSSTATYLAKNDLQLSLDADPDENRRRLLNLFRRMDKDGNGAVTWEEFIAYVQGLQRIAASGAVQSSSIRTSNQNDVLNSSNMPAWAVTQQKKNDENVSQDNFLPTLSLDRKKSKQDLPNSSGAMERAENASRSKNTKKQKRKKRRKKTTKSHALRSPSRLSASNVEGPPQHQLMFEDSFRWNRKNFDLPKRLTEAEKAQRVKEKLRKRKAATAIAPADQVEVLQQQVAQLRNVVKQKDDDAKRKMAATIRSVALMTKRAREAESLLEAASSGQSAIQEVSSYRISQDTTENAEGIDSEVVLELRFRCKELTKQNKVLKTKLREAEVRELDLLDERAAVAGRSPELDSDGSPANTSRSVKSIRGRGNAAVRLEEMRGEIEKLNRELEVAREKSDTAAAAFEHKISSRDTDIRLLKKEVERLKGSLVVEREALKEARKHRERIQLKLARYERLNQKQMMEQDVAATALEAENQRRSRILEEREAEKRRQSEAATTLQAARRGAKARKIAQQQQQRRKKSVTLIQTRWRMFMAGAKLGSMRQAGEFLALRLQSVARGKAARKEIEEQRAATVKIQAIAKGRMERKRMQHAKAEKTMAVTKLQAVQRGRMQKKQFQEEKKLANGAATKLQSIQRGRQGRKKSLKMAQERKLEIQEEVEKDLAITKIQAVHRGKMQRKKFKEHRDPTSITDESSSDSAGDDLLMLAPVGKPPGNSSQNLESEVKETRKPERKMSRMGSLLLNAHRGGDLEKAVENMEEALENGDNINSKHSDGQNEGDNVTPDNELTASAHVSDTRGSEVESNPSSDEFAVRHEAIAELGEIRKVVIKSGSANIDIDNLTQEEAAKEVSRHLAEMTAGLNASSDEEGGFEAHPALEGTADDAKQALKEELTKLETEIQMV